jgi:hypothetical protein
MMATGVVVDPEDNVFVSGSRWDGDPPGFLAKLGPTGDLVWFRKFANSVVAIAVNGEGTVFSISNRDTGASSGQDGVLTEHDSFGEPSRRIDIGSSGTDEALALAVGPDNAIYVGGRTEGDLFAANQGGFDGFLTKYDSSGAFVWGRQFGATGDDAVYDCAVGTDGGIVILAGEVRKLSTTDGSEIWSGLGNGNGYGYATMSIALDGNNDVYAHSLWSLAKFADHDQALLWEWDAPVDDSLPSEPWPGDLTGGPGGLVAVMFGDAYDYVDYDGYLIAASGEVFDQWMSYDIWSGELQLALSSDAVVVAGANCDYSGGYFCSIHVEKTLFQFPK